MAEVVRPDKKKKNNQTLLGGISERLGLEAGTDAQVPRMPRPPMAVQGPLGMPDAAAIAMSQRSANQQEFNMQDNHAMDRTARLTGKTKRSLFGNRGDYTGSGYIR